MLSRSEEDSCLNVGRAIRDGWDMFTDHSLSYIGWTILMTIMLSIPEIVVGLLDDAGLEDAAAVVWVVGLVYTFLIFPPVYFGFFTAAAEERRGEVLSCGSFFRSFSYFFPLLACAILVEIAISIGLFMCILPGIYLYVTLGFAPHLVLEYNEIGVFGALTTSHRISSRSFWNIILLSLACFGILILGILCFGIGIFVAIPVVSLSAVSAFDQLFGVNTNHRIPAGCVFRC